MVVANDNSQLGFVDLTKVPIQHLIREWSVRTDLDSPLLKKEADSDSTSFLIESCRAGRADAMAWLLSQGAQPNHLPGKLAAMHEAARQGFMEGLKTLLAYGANVEVTCGYGLKPIHYALLENRNPDACQVVEFLLLNGADPDSRDCLGLTALMYAITYEQEDVIQVLLNHGANPCIQTHDGASALDILDRKKAVGKPFGYPATEQKIRATAERQVMMNIIVNQDKDAHDLHPLLSI